MDMWLIGFGMVFVVATSVRILADVVYIADVIRRWRKASVAGPCSPDLP